MRFNLDPFIALMLSCALLGFLLPDWGVSDGPLKLGLITKYGISLVFFLHGAALDRQNLMNGLRNIQLHATIQATTFLIFPILGFIAFYLFAGFLSAPLRLGLFFLTALPSTISSSVAMTALAKGNVPGAVFNATLSGLLGMIITPVLITFVVTTDSTNLSLLEAMRDIAITLLLPFGVGHLVRPLLSNFIMRHKKNISWVDRGVILLIILSSFANTTAAGIWTQLSASEFIITLVFILFLLFFVFAMTRTISRILKFSVQDEITAVFCGSTKSLANGAPIANIIFAGSSVLGIILLPVLIYHQLQLIGCAYLARRYERKSHS